MHTITNTMIGLLPLNQYYFCSCDTLGNAQKLFLALYSGAHMWYWAFALRLWPWMPYARQINAFPPALFNCPILFYADIIGIFPSKLNCIIYMGGKPFPGKALR